MKIQIKRLTATAILPTYGTADAAGFDLHADLGKSPFVLVEPGARLLIKTGIAIALPRGLALFICPRSGLSNKSGITVHNGPGVIDADYRGDIGVILHNTTHQQFVVNAGDRIAQGVIGPVIQAEWDEVEKLDPTDRGTGGFGSTGVAQVIRGEDIKTVTVDRQEFMDRIRATPLPYRGEPVLSIPLSGQALMSQRALAQDHFDRTKLAEKPLPNAIVKWLDAEPEEVAAAMVH